MIIWKKTITKLVLLLFVGLLTSACTSTSVPKEEAFKYPRMPDAYRGDGIGKQNSGRNVLGIAIYDAAETAAEEEYTETEVVSLEESQRILKERKANQTKKNKE